MALYLEGTDEIGHVFAPYTPPRLECTSEEDFRRYHRAVDVYYGVVDRMLGQWMRRAKEDGATLIVHSDHGFKWGADRPCARSSLNWATAAFWHRLDGVFAAWGARVRPSKNRAKVSIFDVAPTVLALLGLPADRRMTGKPVGRRVRRARRPPEEGSLRHGRRPARRGRVDVRRRRRASTRRSCSRSDICPAGRAEPLAPAGGDRPGMTEGAWNNLGVYLREETHDLPAAEAAFRSRSSSARTTHSPMFNLAVLYRMKAEDAKAQDWLFRSLDAGPRGAGAHHRGLGRASTRTRGKLPAARALLERAVRQVSGQRAVRARARASASSSGGGTARAPWERSRVSNRRRPSTDTLNALGALPDLPRPAAGSDRALRAVSGVEAGPAGGRPVVEHRAARDLSRRTHQERIDPMRSRKSAVVLLRGVHARDGRAGAGEGEAESETEAGPGRRRSGRGRGHRETGRGLRRPLPSVGPRDAGRGREVAPEAPRVSRRGTSTGPGATSRLKADAVVFVSNDGKWFFEGDSFLNPKPRPVQLGGGPRLGRPPLRGPSAREGRGAARARRATPPG